MIKGWANVKSNIVTCSLCWALQGSFKSLYLLHLYIYIYIVCLTFILSARLLVVLETSAASSLAERSGERGEEDMSAPTTFLCLLGLALVGGGVGSGLDCEGTVTGEDDKGCGALLEVTTGGEAFGFGLVEGGALGRLIGDDGVWVVAGGDTFGAVAVFGGGGGRVGIEE